MAPIFQKCTVVHHRNGSVQNTRTSPVFINMGNGSKSGDQHSIHEQVNFDKYRNLKPRHMACKFIFVRTGKLSNQIVTSGQFYKETVI